MATSDERTRAFNRARDAERARLPRIQADTIREVERQLRDAATSVVEQLRGLADSPRRSQLEALQREIAAALEAFRQSGTRTAQAAADAAWSAGIDLTVLPLAAGGVVQVPHLNIRSLVTLRSSLTSLISDVSLQTINRINAQLAQVMIGTQPAHAALTAIQRLLGGAARERARTILYTEIGRVYAVAAQDSLAEAAQDLPGLRKRWLRSSKLYPRPDHVVAHGQVRLVNEPYVIGGEKLLHPRDPKASARNTVNCGCLSVPVTDGSTWGKATMRLDPFNAAVKLRIVRDS